jgi:hypothetical protein
MKNFKNLRMIVSLHLLLACSAQHGTSAAHAAPATPEAFVQFQKDWEAKLAQKESIEKIVMIEKADALLLKVYYKDGSKAIFKPNTKRQKSLRSALPVYKIASLFPESLKVRYTPMIKFSVSVEEVLALLADNPKTPIDEVALARAALSPEGLAAPENGLLVGSIATWVEGVAEYSKVFPKNDRDALLGVASRLGKANSPGKVWDDQVSNLFVMDYLIANNDRAGNFHFDPKEEVIWAIDNDESWFGSVSGRFVENLILRLEHFDISFISGLERFFASRSDAQLQAEIFTEFPAKTGLKLATEMRARFLFIRARAGRF